MISWLTKEDQKVKLKAVGEKAAAESITERRVKIAKVAPAHVAE
jgi:hypothetical protein